MKQFKINGIILFILMLFTNEVLAQTGKSLHFNKGNFVSGSNTNFPIGNSSRTIELWTKSKPGNHFEVLFNYGTAKNNQRASMMIQPRTNVLYFAGEGNDLKGSTNIKDDKWHHVAATFDGTTLKLFVDGQLEASKTTTFATDGFNFDMGRRIGVANEFYGGYLDEVRVWNTARTEAQLNAWKDKELIGQELGLVAYYNFNHGTPNSDNSTETNLKNQASSTGLGDGILNNFMLGNNALMATITETEHGTITYGDHSDALNLGKYAVLDNSGASKSYISGSNQFLPTGNANRTIELWVKSVAGDNFQVLYNYGSATRNNRASIMIKAKSKRLYYAGEHNDLEGNNANLKDGTWHHVAVTFDGITLKLYVDGVKETTKLTKYETKGTNFDIGRRINANAEFFQGSIDEIRVWDYARSKIEITSKMNSELQGNEIGLVSYFNFNDASIANDLLVVPANNSNWTDESTELAGIVPICIASTPAEFYACHGGKNQFIQNYPSVLDTVFDAKNLIDNNQFDAAETKLKNLLTVMPLGDVKWDQLTTLYKANNSNIGKPSGYAALRMMLDYLEVRKSANASGVFPREITMTYVLVGKSTGTVPQTSTELESGTFSTNYDNSLDPELKVDDYKIIKESVAIFADYILAVSNGYLKLNVEFLELPNYTLSTKIVKGGTNEYKVEQLQDNWNVFKNSVPQEIRDKTDWWCMIYPSRQFEEFENRGVSLPNYTVGSTGGQSGESSIGPIIVVDDRFLMYKKQEFGGARYSDIERMILMPEFYQHEIFHYLMDLYIGAFYLDNPGMHDYWDKNKWKLPLDENEYSTNFEEDFYHQLLFKVLHQGPNSLDLTLTHIYNYQGKLATKLRFQKPKAEDFTNLGVAIDQLLGKYKNDSYEAVLEKRGAKYFWKYTDAKYTGIEFEVFADLVSSGKIRTDKVHAWLPDALLIILNKRDNTSGDFILDGYEIKLNTQVFTKEP